MVADLLSEGGDGWDHGTVDAMFSADDAEDIKQIPVCGHGAHDLLAWNFTKSREFNVRSAYHLAMSLRRAKAGRPEGSSSVHTHRNWLALWNTHVPNKVKILHGDSRLMVWTLGQSCIAGALSRVFSARLVGGKRHWSTASPPLLGLSTLEGFLARTS